MTDVIESRKQWYLKTRAIASGVHFLTSALILGSIIALTRFLWFPEPFFTVDGGWQGLRILLPVDLVLGPVLMFIVFSPSKPRRELVMDIGVIVSVQLAALAWGIHAFDVQRPRFVSSDGEAFYSARKLELDKQQAVDWARLATLSEAHPPMTYTREPQNQDESVGLATMIMTGEVPPHAIHFLQEPLKGHLSQAFAGRIPLSALRADAKDAERLQTFLTSHHGDPADYVYMPLEGNYGRAVLVFSKGGDYLGGFVREQP